METNEKQAVIVNYSLGKLTYDLDTENKNESGLVTFSIIEFHPDWPGQKPEVGEKAIITYNGLGQPVSFRLDRPWKPL